MKIYSIIVTFNAMPWIEKCLTCLSHSTTKTEIIVVDNMSTDGTREYIPQQHPNIIWLPQNLNLGFGQANNVGIKYALAHKFDHIFLLNQDVYIYPNTIENLLKYSDGKSLIVPLQLNGDGVDFDYNYKHAMMKSIDAHCIFDSFVNKETKGKYKIGETNAASWFVPKEMIEEIGGFNPLFFQYGEDNNYFQRIIYHKYPSYVVTNAYVRHDRKIQGNIKAFNKNKIRRDLLLICCNINLSLVQILIGLARLLAKYYIYELARKKYMPGKYFMGILYLFTHLKKICYSRREEIKIKKNWL